jgi:hypothetical protein
MVPETLYAYPVIFDVYVYYDDPVDSLSAGAKTGELVLKKTGRDHGVEANLYRPGTTDALLQTIRHVKVVAMNSTSMVLEGSAWAAERPNASKSKGAHYTVKWVIKHVGAPAVVDAKRLQRRSAGRLAKVLASGFDPADDDRVD